MHLINLMKFNLVSSFQIRQSELEKLDPVIKVRNNTIEFYLLQTTY